MHTPERGPESIRHTPLSDKWWPKKKVRFFVETMAEVKGSPFDPDTKNEVTVSAA